MRSLVVICCTLMTASALASAGEFDDPPLGDIPMPLHPDTAHLDLGIEWLTGDSLATTAFRSSFVVGHSLGKTHDPYLAVGPTFSIGAIDAGEMSARAWSIGPQLQTGATVEDIRFYGNAALEHTSIGSGIISNTIATGWGTRLGVGVDLSTLKWRGLNHLFESSRDPFSAGFGMLMMAAPTHVEIAWDHGAGMDRAGVALAWGL